MSSIGDGIGGWCSARKVPSVAGVGEHVAEPVELRVEDAAVVVAGHRRVEGDDAEPVELVDAILGGVALLAEQHRASTARARRGCPSPR